KQQAQGRLTMGQTVVVEPTHVGTRRLIDMDPSLGAHLPAAVHAPDAKTGITTAMGQTDLEIGAGIHHAAEDKGSEGDSPIDEIPNSVREVIALSALDDQRWPCLVDENQRTHLFCRFPER